MWPLVRTLVVIILVVYQLTIVGLLALSSAYYPTWVCAVATILPTLAYARRMAGRYNASMAGAGASFIGWDMRTSSDSRLAKSAHSAARGSD